MAEKTLPARSEIPEAHQWNAPSVYASHEDWHKEYDTVLEAIPGFDDLRGKLGSGPETLTNSIKRLETVLKQIYKLYTYAVMGQASDSNDKVFAEMMMKIGSIFARFSAAVSFLDPEILTIGEDTLKSWMGENEALAVYRHYLDDLYRKQAHVRSPEVEEVLGLAVDTLFTINNTADMLTDTDMTFAPATDSRGNTFEVAQSTRYDLRASSDRELRRTAYESFSDSYIAFKNTLASNLSAAFKRDVFYARARRYNDSLEATLFENNIPPNVYHNLVTTFKQNLPTWHRYWDVKRRALGLDEIRPYDIWAPITTKPFDIPYEQAVDWIAAGMAPLGEAYAAALRKGCLEDRWVDRYPNQGKRQGAFSTGTQGLHPFIHLSYVNDASSMSTLAHELGHSMHSYLTNQVQPFLYTNYSLFVAEIASNFNQALTRDYLLKNNPDPDFQITIISEAMENLLRYFFIMPILAQWELDMHQRVERGEATTADVMCEVMADLFAEGYGDTMAYDRKYTGIIWAQFTHMYANYYVFQYTTGISGAHAFANRILRGEDNAVEDYLNMLRAGGSGYPLDLVKAGGVDLSTPAAVEETFAVLDGYVTRLEELTAA